LAATEDWSDDEIAILVEDEEMEMAASKRKEQNPETEVLASSSIADPDPYVFGPSGSVCQSTDHQAKIVGKTLIPTILGFLYDF
jgi:hypothetical protein